MRQRKIGRAKRSSVVPSEILAATAKEAVADAEITQEESSSLPLGDRLAPPVYTITYCLPLTP